MKQTSETQTQWQGSVAEAADKGANKQLREGGRWCQ